jgi:hypothetical protein
MALYCQNTMHKSAPAAAGLDDRISEARSQLQRTPEWHPDFERRLLYLIRLVDERDERPVSPCAHATGPGCRNA